MNTGLDSFSDPAQIGALYPLQGTEVLLAIISIALWIAWHVVQTRAETAEYEEAVARYDKIGLEQVMRPGGDVLDTSAGGPGTAGVAAPPPPEGPTRSQ